MAVRGGEGRRCGRIVVRGRVSTRTWNLHRALRPVVVVGQRELPGILLLALAVAEPVVHLELEPRAREDVERRRRDEPLARQELAADHPRVRLQDRRLRLRPGVLERNVAAEARADASHQRVLEVVQGAVDRSHRREAGVTCLLEQLRPGLGKSGVVQVPLAKAIPEPDQRQHADRERQAVPPPLPVEQVADRHQRSREHDGARSNHRGRFTVNWPVQGGSSSATA